MLDKDITHLHPVLQEIIPKFFKACKEKGYRVGLLEGYRDELHQKLRYDQGRINDLPLVTSHLYPYSMHNWGLAFTVYRDDEKGYFNNQGLWFQQIAKVAKEFGLSWNEENKNYFQIDIYGNDTIKLVRKYESPDEFMKTWRNNPNCPHKYFARGLKFKRPSASWLVATQRVMGLNPQKNTNGIERMKVLDKMLDKTIEIGRRKNYKHPLVERVQWRLKDLGYYANKEVTGFYDEYTKDCILRVQKDLGLKRQDGLLKRKDDVWKVLLGIIQK